MICNAIDLRRASMGTNFMYNCKYVKGWLKKVKKNAWMVARVKNWSCARLDNYWTV